MSDIHEKLTVNLIPRTSVALRSLVKLTGHSETDCVNRSINVYAYIEALIQSGGELYVREPGDTSPHVLTIS